MIEIIDHRDDEFILQALRVFEKLVSRQEAAVQDHQIVVGFLAVLVFLLIILTICTHIYYWRK